MPNYIPAAVEPRWQRYWLEHKTFRTPDPGEPGTEGKPKYYILDMFPYPSGSGLHVGHPEGYTATDILARYKRMRGFHVLHPMGWDAFGLPAEQHAIATGEHPSVNTQTNVNTFRRQIQSLGFSYDWDREVDTTDPAYVKWTQWIFLTIYDTWYDAAAKKGRPIAELPIPAEVAAKGDGAVAKYRDSHRLAFMAEVPVNWCEALGTVLSNEEVIDGKSERGSHPVVRRPLKQWLLRITAYAERLIDDLEPLDWSPAIKQMQRNWIGKSEGATVLFPFSQDTVGSLNLRGVPLTTGHIEVFTTRPDTLFGATYLVLSPEHPLVDMLTMPAHKQAVDEYQQQAARKSDFERTEMAKTKTGVFTGATAYNLLNETQIPIWIADYVLASYGTGAIMAVPAHDERDYEFAKQFDLPIVPVVMPPEEWLNANCPNAWEHLKGSFGPEYRKICSLWPPYTGDGVSINSEFLDGLGVADAKAKMIDHLEKEKIGTRKVQYKLRDWLFSRQRYWGEPFPILHEVDAKGERTGVTRALTAADMPVTLPEMADFKPTGSPDGPLAKATDWLTVKLDGKTYRRETNTMPQWAGSCWYYLRYTDAKNGAAFADPAKLNHWLPVDLYVGGAEHAVLHLLYSRFWHKVLFDRGLVTGKEPFQKLVNQGMILGYTYNVHVTKDGKDVPFSDYDDHQPTTLRQVPFEEVEERDSVSYLKGSNFLIDLEVIAEKMSKSRGNVINPDDVITSYGADSLRLYEMFMGPLEAVKPWNTKGVEGVYRFIGRTWRLFIDDSDEAKLNAAVQDVPPDRDTLRVLHRTIQKVGDDTEGMRFNTAISAMMEFVNHMTKLEVRPRAALEPFVLLLAPYAPHVAEELWAALGHANTLAYEPFPAFDPDLVKEDEIEVPVQVNGKLKVKLKLPAGADNAAMEAAALADAKVKETLAGKPPKKVIVVPKKLVNIVA